MSRKTMFVPSVSQVGLLHSCSKYAKAGCFICAVTLGVTFWPTSIVLNAELMCNFFR
jgi:hypothetical protein